METITAQEFEKRYGKEALAKFDTPTDVVRKKQGEKTGQTPGVLGKVARFTGVDPFTKGIASTINSNRVTRKVANFFGLGIDDETTKNLDESLAKGVITYNEYAKAKGLDLTPKEVAGGALSAAALFAPGAGSGAGLATKIGAGAATGYALDVGTKLQDKNKTTEEAFEPGVGTAVGATLPLIGGIIGKTLKNAPQSLEKINLRMTPTERQKLNQQGKDIVQFMADKKVIGTPETRFQKIDKLYDEAEESVSQVINNANVNIDKKKLLQEISQIPEQFSRDIVGYQPAVKAVEDAMEFLQKKSPDQIPGALINDYKRRLFKRAYSKDNTQVVNETLHAIGELLKSKLDESVPGLESINREYGNLILARKILGKAVERPETGLVSKLTSAAAGTGIGYGVGGTLGGAIGGILGQQVAEKAAGTLVRSTTGAVLKSIDQMVSKIPTDKLGNLQITRKALIKLFQQ